MKMKEAWEKIDGFLDRLVDAAAITFGEFIGNTLAAVVITALFIYDLLIFVADTIIAGFRK